MSFINKRNGIKDNSLVAVFDVASASVGGLLFRYQKNALPEIITSVRNPAELSLEQGFNSIWRSLQRSFEEVSNHLKESLNQKPEFAFCIFSSPWYMSQTRIIKVKREKDFVVEKQLIKKLVEDEMNTFKKLWQESALSPKGDAFILENLPIKFMANGYSIENPTSLSIQNLELYAYLSLGLNLLKDKIKEDILNYVKPQNIYFHSFPFVLFLVLKNLINVEEGFIFLDITGELTDVFLIRNGVIEESNCFSRGENFLIRRLASAFNVEVSEARSIMAQYQRGELEPSHAEKVSRVLKPAGEEWANSLKKLLKQMAQNKPLPQYLYFCGRSSLLKEVNEPVSAQNFATLTTLRTPFVIKYLNPEALMNHFNFNKGFSNNKDIFLLLATLFAQNALKNNHA